MPVGHVYFLEHEKKLQELIDAKHYGILVGESKTLCIFFVAAANRRRMILLWVVYLQFMLCFLLYARPSLFAPKQEGDKDNLNLTAMAVSLLKNKQDRGEPVEWKYSECRKFVWMKAVEVS